MTLDAEILADRRRLRRRLSVWRVAAVALAVVALVAVAASLSGETGLTGLKDHIARVTVSGVITDDREQQALFDKILKADRVKAIILHIDSPGGTTSGAEALFAAVRRLASTKPVVAVVGDVAASGGYIVALASDHIVARGNSITGSIGVIFQWADITALLKTLGVEVEQLKSSELKAEPDLFGPTPEAALEVMRAMVQDSQDWFVNLVAERRPFDEAQARALSDGRVYTGRQALAAHLIDAIGGEITALEWLRSQRDVPRDLDIVDWTAETAQTLSWRDLALAWSLRRLGLGDVASLLGFGEKTSPTERLSLDGLISVWHPDL